MGESRATTDTEAKLPSSREPVKPDKLRASKTHKTAAGQAQGDTLIPKGDTGEKEGPQASPKPSKANF